MSEPTFDLPPQPGEPGHIPPGAVAAGNPGPSSGAPLPSDGPLVHPDYLPAGGALRQPGPHEDELTPLGELLGELTVEVTKTEKTWPIPTRPGWAARFRTDVSKADFDRAKKQAQYGPKRPGEDRAVNELQQGLILLGTYNVALLRQVGGQWIEATEQGSDTPLTFRSPQFMGLYQVQTAAGAAWKLYGTDGAALSAGRALMEASGWLDDQDEVQLGPTPGSSPG